MNNLYIERTENKRERDRESAPEQRYEILQKCFALKLEIGWNEDVYIEIVWYVATEYRIKLKMISVMA